MSIEPLSYFTVLRSSQISTYLPTYLDTYIHTSILKNRLAFCKTNQPLNQFITYHVVLSVNTHHLLTYLLTL